MLERVPLLDKHLDDYAEVVEPGTLERIRELAKPLQGARILHINATAYGGGVAELLATHVALSQDIGIEAEWQVIHGSDEFFATQLGRGFFGTQETAPFTVNNPQQGDIVLGPSALPACTVPRVVLDRRG